jgi:ATP-dependent protease ClpP protease subunit
MKYWQKDGDPATAVMKFYGLIGVWYQGADDFTSTISEIEEKYSNLEIRMHCYGGQVFEGSVMFNAIQASKLNVTVCIEGVAASMASIVMLAAKKIVMAENAFVMVHVPKGCTEGTADDHFATGKLLKSMQANFAKAYCKKTGKNMAFVQAWLDGSDHWFDSTECKSFGLVDEVVGAVDTNASAMGKPDNGTEMETVYSRYTAIGNSNNSHHNQTSTMDKAKLISLFGLTGVTADSSDTAVMAAIEAHHNNTNARMTQLETGAKEGIRASATAIITAREKELKTTFTEAQKTGFMAVAEKMGIDSMNTMLSIVQPVPVIASLLTPEGKEVMLPTGGNPIAKEREAWDFDTWQEKDPAGLEKLPKDAFAKLYLAKYPNGAKDLK